MAIIAVAVLGARDAPKQSRLVLIEDDAALRREIEKTLHVVRYKIEVHADAFEAWEALRGGGPLDVLITELVSPQGRPHGLALAPSSSPDVPVVFITDDFAAAQFARGEPRSVLLMKPFEMTDLHAAVREAICCGQPLSANQQPQPSIS